MIQLPEKYTERSSVFQAWPLRLAVSELRSIVFAYSLFEGEIAVDRGN